MDSQAQSPHVWPLTLSQAIGQKSRCSCSFLISNYIISCLVVRQKEKNLCRYSLRPSTSPKVELPVVKSFFSP